MNLYRYRITDKLAEYAIKKYKSHRKIPENILKKLNKIN